jgi:hypothetical protein
MEAVSVGNSAVEVQIVGKLKADREIEELCERINADAARLRMLGQITFEEDNDLINIIQAPWTCAKNRIADAEDDLETLRRKARAHD